MSVNYYRDILMAIEQKEDYSDEDIQLLDQNISKFTDCWIEVASSEGYTNYFHYMISGHILYFAKNIKTFTVSASRDGKP